MSSMHVHADSRSDRRILALSLALLTAFMVGEVVFGILADSLALLADAGHMLTDAFALGLALFAAWAATLPARGRWTFGFARAEILAAQANGITLALISIAIVYSAIRRLIDPPDVHGGIVTIVALVGIAVNIGVLALLARARRQSLNIRGAYLHIATDLAAFVGTVVAGILILATGWDRFDALVSLFVAALMLGASVVGVQIDGPARRRKRPLDRIALAGLGVEDEPGLIQIEQRQHRPRRGVGREASHGTFQAAPDERVLIRAELGPVDIEAERTSVGLEVVGRLVGRLSQIRSKDDAVGLRHGGRHPTRDVFLDGEDVGQLAVVIVRPQTDPVIRPDKLCRDPHAVAGPAHTSLEQMLDIQSAANFRKVDVLSTKLE